VGRVVRAGELALALIGSFVMVVAAQGWLYEIRPTLPRLGPAVRDALPLDELPRHDAVPLVVFFVVWAIVGLLVGILARTARVERLTAALLAALAAGAWLLLTTWVSIVVVRQIDGREAFRAAIHVPAIYLAAGLVGLGAAVVGRAGAPGRARGPLILAALVATAGLLDVASAITPEVSERLQLFENAVPNVVPRLASALIVPVGMALMVLARALRRRSRRAWQLTVALVLAAAALHILKGLEYEEATASILLAIALVASRDRFDRRGAPGTRTEVFVRGLLYVVAIFVYGAIALWINRVAADRRYSLGFAFHETAAALAGLHPRGSTHLSGSFGEWFPLSVFLLGLTGAFSLLVRWLAPWRYRHKCLAQERERARALVSRFGVDTLAPFALRSDKSYFFSEDERAFLAYTVIAGVAVVSGDPIGEADSVEQLVGSFARFARARDWRIAILGAGARYLELYRRHGLSAIYHGDEGVIDVRRFSTEGRSIRKVRQSVHRLGRAGYTAEILYARDLDDELRRELELVAVEWRRGEPLRGFTMEFDSFFTLDGDEALFVIGRDASGRVAGFLHLAVSRAARALSLSSMPRRLDTPNGLNEWLVVETVTWARQQGFGRVSMNFAPFASLLGSKDELSPAQRLQGQILRRLKGTFQFDNLSSFNGKFFPSWERRYVVYERLADLPRVGLAGLAAEGYLPRVGQRR
jgi:lysyl-tRNA synthetase, class II